MRTDRKLDIRGIKLKSLKQFLINPSPRRIVISTFPFTCVLLESNTTLVLISSYKKRQEDSGTRKKSAYIHVNAM